MESLLIITGTMGAGKTTVLGEASDILRSRQIPHAAIDMDALGLAHLPSALGNDAVMYRNLQSVYENYTSLGVPRFLLARAIEDPAELELCRGIFSATNTVVCRLTLSVETIERRVKMRERGIFQHEYVTRAATLNAILDRAHLEDLSVTSENRSVSDVARDVLVKAKWILDELHDAGLALVDITPPAS